jgi:hypothetical protein
MDNLNQFIEQHEGEVFTLGPVDPEEIGDAEARLGHRLPEELREYLQRYGALSYRSVEFFGLGMKPSSHLHLVQRTLEFRGEEGFPPRSVVLEDLGDGHFAVCRPDGVVLEWASPTYVGEAEPMAPSPEAYMLARLREA